MMTQRVALLVLKNFQNEKNTAPTFARILTFTVNHGALFASKGVVSCYLYRIVRCLLPVEAADGSLDHAGVLLDLEDGRPGVLVDDVFLDRVAKPDQTIKTLFLCS